MDAATVSHNRILSLLALAALSAVPIAACGSSPTPSSATEAAHGSNATEEFGLTLTQLADRIESTEALIAQCMSAAGFQYVALDFATIKQAMSSDQSAPGVSGDDYIKQYGLGITTQFDQPIITFGAGPDNTAYLAGLSPTDQTAFKRTLWGESPDWNHAHAVEAEDFSQTGGCTHSAAAQTYSATELGGAYVNPADARLAQDPRMIAAIAAWSECMRAEGYDYADPLQVERDLHERLAAITQGQDPKSLAGPALDALHALQGEELAVAALLTTCEQDKIEPVQAAIEAELYGSPQS